MKKATHKTYLVTEAAEMIGCNPITLYRQCRAGKLGERIAIPGTSKHFFRISGKEIAAIKGRKNQGFGRMS